MDRLKDFIKDHKYLAIALVFIMIAAVVTVAEEGLGVFEEKEGLQTMEPQATGTSNQDTKDVSVEGRLPESIGEDTLGDATFNEEITLRESLMKELTHNLFTDNAGGYLAFSTTSFAEYEQMKGPEFAFTIQAVIHTEAKDEDGKNYEQWRFEAKINGRTEVFELKREVADDGMPIGDWVIKSLAFKRSEVYRQIGEAR